MGGVVSRGANNDDLIDKLKEAKYIKDPLVERAFRLVDRANYIPDATPQEAYSDNAWKSGKLHLSAPCIYAQVLESLKLSSGMSFLNIGSGTGYLSTMAGLLIGSNGVNHGVEVHNEVVEYARDRLEHFEKNNPAIDVTSFCEPYFIEGNGFCLSVDMIAYDRVYVGASCPPAQENYMKNMLKVGGILVMPRNGDLVEIVRISSDDWKTEKVLSVSFASLIGYCKTLHQESIALPTVVIPTLQEFSREVIRTSLRNHIECENKELKDSFIHKIKTTCSSKKSSVVRSRSFLNSSVSDNEVESDDEDDNLYEDLPRGQNQTSNQILAFLASNLTRDRNHSGEQDDAASMEEHESEGTSMEGMQEETLSSNEDLTEPTGNNEMENIPGETLSCRDSSEDFEINCKPNNAKARVSRAHSLLIPSQARVSIAHSLLIPSQASYSKSSSCDDEVPKKREKIDSGICEDLDQREASSSSPSCLSESDDKENLVEQEHTSRAKICRRRRRRKNRISKNDLSDSDLEASPPSQPSPTDRYSKLLTASVNQLPLPNALKVYVNYNRPL